MITTIQNLSTHLPVLKVDTETLLRSDGLNTTLLSQVCILANSSHYGNGEWKVHFKERGGDEEPQIAPGQLKGQPEFTSL